MKSGPGFEHPADGWYLIEPIGEHPNRAADVVLVVDYDAAVGMSDSFNAAAGDPNYPGLLVDRDHLSKYGDQESRAEGWLVRTQARPDGLYGQIRWTKSGQAAVDGGEYRFFSTEYDLRDCQVLSHGKPRRVRPLKLDGLALTNQPNNRAGQKPITNRRESAPAAAPVDSAAAAVTSREANSAAAELRELVAASQACMVVCKRLQSQHSLTFEAAWNHAQLQEPGLFEKMASQTTRAAEPLQLNRAATGVGAALTPRQVNSAAARFNMVVLNRQSRERISYERAHNKVALELPDVFARAHGRVLNRASYYIEPEAQREAERLAPGVLRDLLAAKAATPDRGNTTRPQVMREAFISALRMLQEDGLTLAAAFARLREDEPVFWVRGVLSFEQEEDGSQPFTAFEADASWSLPGDLGSRLQPRLKDQSFQAVKSQ